LAKGKAAARKLTHARILLKADSSPGSPSWTDARIGEALEVDAAILNLTILESVWSQWAAILPRQSINLAFMLLHSPDFRAINGDFFHYIPEFEAEKHSAPYVLADGG
jgi:hypothetical protein